MNDLFGSMEQLAEWSVNGLSPSVTAHGYAKETSSASVRPCSIYGIENLISVNVTQTDEVKVMIKAEIPNAAIGALASVGATNPLDIAWEMIPYSFVVDWFVTIGQSLRAVDAGSYLSFKEGSVTRFRKRHDPQFSAMLHPHYAVESAGVGGTFSSYAMWRRVLDSIPVLLMPHLKLELSGLQMAQGLSLLSVAVNKRRHLINWLL